MGLFGKRKKSNTQTAPTESFQKDDPAAEIRTAAEQGDPDAQYQYALMYYQGKGMPQDPAKALTWFRKAAEQGDADAQAICGMMYDDGVGTKQDKAKALYWYEKAGEQGKDGHSYICGVMYENGIGARKNPAKAAYWYEKSARQGAAPGQFEYGMLLYRKEEYEEAFRWFEKAAEQGYASAQFNCGTMCESGKGTEKDPVKALYWYEKAADQDYFNAFLNCGMLYHNGGAAVENPEKALYWFMKVLMSEQAAQDEPRAYAAARRCTTLFRDRYGTLEELGAVAHRVVTMPVLLWEYGEAKCDWTEVTKVLDVILELRKQ